MSEQSHMEAREAFFDRYRRLKEKNGELDAELEQLRQTFQEQKQNLHDQMMRNAKELTTMRHLITAMIDNGWDPMEAKLKLPELDPDYQMNNRDLWDQDMNEKMRMGSTGSISLGNLTALNQIQLAQLTANPNSYPNIGPTGAIGSITLGPTMTSGANGPSGYVDGHGDYQEIDNGGGYSYSYSATAEL